MDFIIGLLRTVRQHDSIMVVVDRLTKVSHFIPMKSIFLASDVAHVSLEMWLDCMVFQRKFC